ncbi:MAG: hypothetical protein RMJ67_07150 [Elusimicrobiota bacterium]|nr:hypothetical protein [Endomicrobiia bacterium]MDW8166270.1 hypothetical protein [Elusimicrobiota bacterium]
MNEITVKDLFYDAAILSDREKGIPHFFCIEPEERKKFWQNLTKHSATKPISQAFHAIMMNRSFDEVMERFLRTISVKIPKNEDKVLENFISHVKKILKKYYELRQKNITEFLKAKNSLISAVFILTRYPNLKEVLYE